RPAADDRVESESVCAVAEERSFELDLQLALLDAGAHEGNDGGEAGPRRRLRTAHALELDVVLLAADLVQAGAQLRGEGVVGNPPEQGDAEAGDRPPASCVEPGFELVDGRPRVECLRIAAGP